MNAKPIQLTGYRSAGQRRADRFKRLSRIAYLIAAFFAAVGIVAAFVPLVLDAAERESQWRADRLCRIYDVCDPKAGP